jgi:two-component system, OmpR family, response regulator
LIPILSIKSIYFYNPWANIQPLGSDWCNYNWHSFVHSKDMKALIIDDEPDTCLLLSGILRRNNLDPYCVTNLSELDQALETHSPSIIFLDNNLPDGLGMNYIDKIKINYPKAKIVMITANDSNAIRNIALEKGADLFLGKPFTIHAINAAVNKLCA